MTLRHLCALLLGLLLWLFPAPVLADSTVIVAVIDTGVDCNHPMLMGRCVAGRSFVDGVSNEVAVDVAGHGTQIAGIIAVRSNALIMPVRLTDFNRPQFTPEDIAVGTRWAADNGARIIVLALGSSVDYPAVREAVAYACQRGVTVIAPAGNHGTNLMLYPAGYRCVIAVGALDAGGRRAQTEWWASGYGRHVRVWRYGIEIVTIAPTYDTGAGLGDMISGTSAAAAVYAAERANR